jgi:Flp pilus assembly protein protease CpaA
MNFIFWFFLSFLLIASLQDLKRREIDNWLNLLLFFSGFLYLIYNVLIYNEVSLLINFGFMSLIMFGVSYLFYYLRIFAGGDCKLLFALTPMFVSLDLVSSMFNIIFFCLILLFIGAIYGLFWIFYLFFKNYNTNLKFLRILILKNYILFILIFLILSMGLFNKVFIFLFSILLFLTLLFFISKVVETNSLIKEVYPRNLREGDWLNNNISFNNKIIRTSFEGLSMRDIKFLKKFPSKISIKEGIPYAPVFLFSWLLFYFRGSFMALLDSILASL